MLTDPNAKQYSGRQNLTLFINTCRYILSDNLGLGHDRELCFFYGSLARKSCRVEEI
jgi:hypothetical protein